MSYEEAKWDVAKWDQSFWDITGLLETYPSLWDVARWDKTFWDSTAGVFPKPPITGPPPQFPVFVLIKFRDYLNARLKGET